MRPLSEAVIGIIGLGYVGLPLAVEFARKYKTIGFDINKTRIAELIRGEDKSREVEPEVLSKSDNMSYTQDLADLAECTIYIVTVPTPIDSHKRPDLSPLIAASQAIGKILGPEDIVIFESTVYPGATEEICVPVLESESGWTFNRDFFVGYSPERINPGDREHRITNIKKVTSGSTQEVAERVDALYCSIIEAGTHKASSIRVAEAAKVIENTQRDVNIALINELAILFEQLGLNTLEILEAAGSKWNFLPFRPGLVGGHCIGVDPYYLTHKAQAVGYHPEMILAGRRINDGMGAYVVQRVVKLMTTKRIHVAQSNVLIMGITFKENCPDIRNTRVVDMIEELRGYSANVDVYDTWADPTETRNDLGIDLIENLQPGSYDAVILAVAHDSFKQMGGESIRKLGKSDTVVFDVKHTFPQEFIDEYL